MRGPGPVRPDASLAAVGCDSDVAASKTASQNLYIFEQAVRTASAAAGPIRRPHRRRHSRSVLRKGRERERARCDGGHGPNSLPAVIASGRGRNSS